MVGAAAANHSHNYAGADSAGGAANVANSLNGTARYVTTDSVAKPYWRCLKIESAKNWFDGSVILCVDAGYDTGGFGILTVRLRNDNVAESTEATHGTVQWLCRSGYAANQFILKIHSAKATTGYADLYFCAAGAYNACNVRILAASTRGTNGSAWTLMNDEPRAAMDTRAYTAQAIGYDVGNVAYASSAGSANSVSWGNVSGKPSTYVPSSHTHDDRYYTESEINTKLNDKANSSHTHDDRYYTESEINTKLNGKANSSHTHDDRYYTESETDTKLNAKAASDIITISSTKPTSNTCKLWIKI